MIDLHPSYCPATLCEVCTKSTGFCSWSEKDNQQPVPGWDAVRKDLLAGGGRKNIYTESYIVLRCPQFELEEHNRWAFERFEEKRTRGETRRGVKRHVKMVRCIDTGKEYPSVRAASLDSGCTEHSIRCAATGQTRKTREGTRWEYITEETSCKI